MNKAVNSKQLDLIKKLQIEKSKLHSLKFYSRAKKIQILV